MYKNIYYLFRIFFLFYAFFTPFVILHNKFFYLGCQNSEIVKFIFFQHEYMWMPTSIQYVALSLKNRTEARKERKMKINDKRKKKMP